MSTSCSAGTGRSTSRRSTASGEPAAAGTRAFIQRDLVCGWRSKGAPGWMRCQQPVDEVVGEGAADFFRCRPAAMIEPSRNPVHGAHDGERQQLGIPGPEELALDSGPDQALDAMVERIALGDDLLSQCRRQRMQVE